MPAATRAMPSCWGRPEAGWLSREVRGRAPAELVPRMKAFLEGLKPQVELAEKHRTDIAIENHARPLDSIDSIKAFVDLNKSPRVGIALAPFHIQARGESVTEAILAAGPQLLFFYAWQYDPAMSVKQLPGLGPADLRAWIAALAKIQYRGYVNPFLHDQPPPDQTARRWPSRSAT